jgi:hypothetical protein
MKMIMTSITLSGKLAIMILAFLFCVLIQHRIREVFLMLLNLVLHFFLHQREGNPEHFGND